MNNRYRLQIFGTLDDTDAFDKIADFLSLDPEPLDRVRKLESLVAKNDGVLDIRRSSKFGSPFDDLKSAMVLAGLGWQELTAEEDGQFHTMITVLPGESVENTIDLADRQPALTLSKLLIAEQKGLEAVAELIADLKRHSLIGVDKKLAISPDLNERYANEFELEDDKPGM